MAKTTRKLASCPNHSTSPQRGRSRRESIAKEVISCSNQNTDLGSIACMRGSDLCHVLSKSAQNTNLETDNLVPDEGYSSGFETLRDIIQSKRS